MLEKTSVMDNLKGASQFSRCQSCATRSVCIVSGLTPSSARMLATVIRERPFRKGEAIQPEGKLGGTIAIVKLGAIMMYRKGNLENQLPVALFGRGRLMGALGLLGQANQLSGFALSAGRICEIETEDLYRLGLIDRLFLVNLYASLTQSYGWMADWARVVRVKGVPAQVLAALKLIAHEQGHSSVRLPSHVALAELLATTRESVARALRQLERQGHLIRVDRWHCQIVNTKKLEPQVAELVEQD
jgi:CRP/FNR family cyclic AMP-dependent transcriptional regulator